MLLKIKTKTCVSASVAAVFDPFHTQTHTRKKKNFNDDDNATQQYGVSSQSHKSKQYRLENKTAMKEIMVNCAYCN